MPDYPRHRPDPPGGVAAPSVAYAAGPAPRREATYADLEALPEHRVGELIQGVLYVSPRPGPAHAGGSSVLGMDLGGPYHRRAPGPKGPGGWWIVDEPELHFGRDVLVPDLAGWRRERMPCWPRTSYFTLGPDWVCEVLSPRTALLDRNRKARVYAEQGVPWLWLLDPEERMLEVWKLEQGRWMVHGVWGNDETVRVEPFAEVELELARWWEGQPAEPEGEP